jgi:hypothetical protein
MVTGSSRSDDWSVDELSGTSPSATFEAYGLERRRVHEEVLLGVRGLLGGCETRPGRLATASDFLIQDRERARHTRFRVTTPDSASILQAIVDEAVLGANDNGDRPIWMLFAGNNWISLPKRMNVLVNHLTST